MAGAHSIMAAENMETSLSAIKDQWEIEFSRFFNYPSLSSTSLSLKPINFKRIRCRGTWISSSSTASLHLLTYHSNPEVILIVSFRGMIHIQKFALRFSTSCEAQTFLNALKESLKVVRNIGLPISGFGSEILSQSEFISSNGLQFRADEEFSFVTPVDAYTPQRPPALKYEGEEHTCSQETVLSCYGEGISESLPPSFTALLTNCCAEAGQEQSTIVPEEIDLQTQITVSVHTLHLLLLVDVLGTAYSCTLVLVITTDWSETPLDLYFPSEFNRGTEYYCSAIPSIVAPLEIHDGFFLPCYVEHSRASYQRNGR
ncbi:hypothetical protein HHK36_015627 [Tetracentron sinense]|uniref:Poor homologous synapsis 1 PH domain-containing protein n=1 Tax=Tetracentron sinense TaxID=13715 RepID=A0A834Z9M1_TETSI|nr:hypothetical protein HHK36_015627 [Tetracentron sinense]